MQAPKKKRLGDMLVESGLIDKLQLRAALVQQEQWGKPLGRTLVEMRLVTEDQLVRVLSEQLHLPTVDLSTTPVAPEALAFLGEEFCRGHECLPFAYDTKNRFLDIAMSDIQNQLLYDTLRVRTRCNVRPFLAGPDAIRDAIERAFGQSPFEMELQFQLAESLFDFGCEERDDQRHVDPAVRPTTSTQAVVQAPAPRAAPGPAATSEHVSPFATGPFPTTPPGLPPQQAPSHRGPSAPPQPPRAPRASPRHPARGTSSLDALAQQSGGLPAYPGAPPVGAAGSLTRAGLAELVVRQQAVEDRLVGAMARLDQHEAFLQRLLADLRGFFGQLAQLSLIEAPPGHPLLPEPGRPATAAPTPVPVAVTSSGLPPPPAGLPLPFAAPPPPRPTIQTFSVPAAEDAPARPRSSSSIPAAAPGTGSPAEPRRPPRDPGAPSTGGEERQPADRLVAAPRRPPPSEIHPAPPAATSGTEALLPLLELPADAQTAVAMDLGTTRSSVATVVNGRVSVLKLPGGNWDIPSVVGFRADGQVVLGKAARQMLSNDAENVIASPKRLLGRRFDEPALGPYLAQLGMKATADKNKDIILHSRGRRVSVTEACSHLLKLLRLVGERTLGRPVHDVILTVPATSGERQLRALSVAAATAELRVVEFLHEPVAAAMACVFDEACDGRVAVYDFGGGTFDFSVVELGAEAMQVVATSGDSWLGGDDFDAALAAAAANACWQQHKVELRNQAHHWQALLVACETAKRALSEQQETVVRLPGVVRQGDSEAAFEFLVTRKKFAELTRGIVDRSLETCQEALALAKMQPSELNAVYLSGGTSYIPSVHEAVATFFGKPPRVVIPPERMVVVGAAVHGALMPPGN